MSEAHSSSAEPHSKTRTDDGSEDKRRSTPFLEEESWQRHSHTHAWHARAVSAQASVTLSISRTLRPIWVAVLLQIRFGHLVRERLATSHVSAAPAGKAELAAPCKPAR